MNNNEKINYIEFPAHDMDATEAFFSKTFDWTFEHYGPDYTAFFNAGLDGGFYRSELRSVTEKGSVLVVFYSSDLEETLSNVIENGGAITKDIFSFPGGRRFHFTEPSGNEFAVWSE